MLFYNTYIPGKTLSLDFICFEHALQSIVELLYVTFLVTSLLQSFQNLEKSACGRDHTITP